jgi:hypothetical protein
MFYTWGPIFPIFVLVKGNFPNNALVRPPGDGEKCIQNRCDSNIRVTGIALLENVQAELVRYRAGLPAVVPPLDGLDQRDTDMMEILEVYR